MMKQSKAGITRAGEDEAMNNQIEIQNYRASFRDLEVGDQFLICGSGFHSHWELREVTRVTDNHFIYGYGAVKPSGLNEYQDKYSRDNGDLLGGKWKRAHLPTPELVARINAETADRHNRRIIRDTELRSLTDEQAAQIAVLLTSFKAEVVKA